MAMAMAMATATAMGLSSNASCSYAEPVLSSMQAAANSILGMTSPAATLLPQNSFTCVESYQIILSPRKRCWALPFTSSLARRLYPTPTAKERTRRAAHLNHLRGHHLHVVAKLGNKDQQGVGAAEIAGIAGGLFANPVVAWSLYTLKTTGCGLPPGPGGAIGALEGISYVVIIALTGWSIYTKLKTGSGLPGGPLGLLGAVEGLSFLTILATVVVFGLQYVDYGYIPGPVPGEQCFG